MTMLCVPITVEPDDAGPRRALEDARAAQAATADIVEFRIDNIASDAPDAPDAPDAAALADSAAALVAESPLPAIVTCRSATEGGSWTGDDTAVAAIYRALADAPNPPAYLDIEFASLERSPELAALARELKDRARAGAVTPRVIASLHDFHTRPADINRRLARMRDRDDIAVIKIAHRARSLRDNLELFEILATRDRPTIALGMGEFGLMSRVLAPKFGGFLTFATLREESATAPGQPTVAELLDLYRFRSINAKTQVFGVIGWPIGHSKSPAAHNAAFAAAGFDGVYLPLPVPPEWEHFKATLGALVDDPRLGIAGASVTIPHKQHLVRYAHEHYENYSPAVRESRPCEDQSSAVRESRPCGRRWSLDDFSASCAAANTLSLDDSGMRVSNTDAPAIVSCLRDAGFDPRGGSVAILGAGGVARAAAAALTAEGATVTIYNRTRERADEIARDLGEFADQHCARIVAAPMSHAIRTCAGAIINATPIGMTGGPAPGETPIDLRALADAGRTPIVFDTVYTPRETTLILTARELGMTTVDGAALFVAQAEMQSRLFIGCEPPAGVIRDAMGG